MIRARIPILTAPLVVALLLATNAGFAASFDCAKARSQVEKLICADPHAVMAFESEAGNRRFDSWLHDRPEFSGGTWSLENCVVHIGHPSQHRFDTRLHVLRYSKGVLSLRDQQTQQAVIYVRLP